MLNRFLFGALCLCTAVGTALVPGGAHAALIDDFSTGGAGPGVDPGGDIGTYREITGTTWSIGSGEISFSGNDAGGVTVDYSMNESPAGKTGLRFDVSGFSGSGPSITLILEDGNGLHFAGDYTVGATGAYDILWSYFDNLPMSGNITTVQFVYEGTGASDTLDITSFSFTPVPEPATFGSALLGLATLFGWYRRRLRRAVALV